MSKIGSGSCLPLCCITKRSCLIEDSVSSAFWVLYVIICTWKKVQMFSVGDSSKLQAGQFGTQTLLLLSHACIMWFHIVFVTQMRPSLEKDIVWMVLHAQKRLCVIKQ